MSKIKFLKTDDESTGLYSEDAGDIFHSVTGAYLEAKEKFVLPLFDTVIGAETKLDIADICFGIGYNTKTSAELLQGKELNITAFEFDEDLILISPFIKDNINNTSIKIELLYNLLKNGVSLTKIMTALNSYNAFDDAGFFEPVLTSFIKFLHSDGYNYNPLELNRLDLHNIYYRYISNNMNNALKTTEISNFNFDFFSGDARKTFSLLNTSFDVVFLDAFSSQKDPSLWTIDFLSLVSKKMNYDSVLLSYSKSTPFRSALLKIGFNIGMILSSGNESGTIASFNPENILHPLTDFDTGLISTRSGIPYKDPCLNLRGDIILKNRDIEMKNSDLLSQTQYRKRFE